MDVTIYEHVCSVISEEYLKETFMGGLSFLLHRYFLKMSLILLKIFLSMDVLKAVLLYHFTDKVIKKQTHTIDPLSPTTHTRIRPFEIGPFCKFYN